MTWEDLVDGLDTGRSASERESAWRELETRLKTIAMRVAMPHRGISAADIEDVVQQILLELQTARGLNRLRATRSPEGYLAVVTKHAMFDILRKRRLEAREPAKDSLVAVDGISWDERIDALRDALGRLDSQELTILRWKYWEDLSIGELAARLGVSYSAAAKRLFRVVSRLRADLEPH